MYKNLQYTIKIERQLLILLQHAQATKQMREFKEIKGACLTTWNRRGGRESWEMELSVDYNIDQYQHC